MSDLLARTTRGDSPTLRLARSSPGPSAVIEDRGDTVACVWGFDHSRKYWAAVAVVALTDRRVVPVCYRHLTGLREAGRVWAVAMVGGPEFGPPVPATLF